MRSELLGLAAALRAGQLVASTLKKAAGLKTRGNEALDVTGDLSKEEIEHVHGRLAAVWKQIGICLSDVRQYGWSHPQATRALEVGYQQMTDALVAHPGNVRWDVGPGAFVFEGNAVWAPDRIPFDRVPYQLFADGVRRIQIKDGFTKEEFRDLVAILLHDVMGHESSEDDAVTALWDRRFEHVAYVAIEAFDGSGATDGPIDDTPLLAAIDLAKEMAERAQLDRDVAVDGSLEGRAMQMNLAAQLKEAGEAAAALAIDPLTRATLGAQLNMSEEAWRERFVDAFADGYLEARPHADVKLLHDALAEFREDQLKLHDHASLFALLEDLEKALAARAPNDAKALEDEVARVVVPPATLASILQELAAKESDANVASGVAKALARLGDASMLELACGLCGTTRSEPLKNVLASYVKSWARGNEARLGNVAATGAPDASVMCVALLAEIGGVEALRAIESALRSPHLDVRVEALSRLPEDKDELVRAEVRAMFENPASSVRTQALNLVAERELFAAGPAIVLTVQSPKFSDIPVEERRLWLRSLARLSPRRASEVCAGIVADHKLVPTEAVETTRVLCAEVLAEVASSKEALDACVEASKKRWWNTQPVRDAAERAAQQIQARLEAGVPEAVTTGKRKKVVLE